MKKNWKLLSLAGAAALCLPLARSLSKGASAPVEPSSTPSPRRVAATGRIEAWREATVRFNGPGRVVRYLRAEGDWVRAGEPVVELDQDMERAALAEADAELFQAESRQKRVATLRGTSSVSDQEADDAEGAYRLAKAKREHAVAALNERTLRAPFSGRILKTFLEAGESAPGAQSYSPLFEIGDMRRLKVVADVDELDVSRVAAGGTAIVVPDALAEQSFVGRISKVAGLLGRKTILSDDPRERTGAKTLEIEIELPADPRLKPGMTVQARIEGPAGQS